MLVIIYYIYLYQKQKQNIMKNLKNINLGNGLVRELLNFVPSNHLFKFETIKNNNSITIKELESLLFFTPHSRCESVISELNVKNELFKN